MKKKINDESELIISSKDLLSKLLAEHAKDNRKEIDPIKESKIKSILSRTFNNELDYLERNSVDYFELYGQKNRHFKNLLKAYLTFGYYIDVK